MIIVKQQNYTKIRVYSVSVKKNRKKRKKKKDGENYKL